MAASEEVTEVVSAAVSEAEVSERSFSSKIDYFSDSIIAQKMTFQIGFFVQNLF